MKCPENSLQYCTGNTCTYLAYKVSLRGSFTTLVARKLLLSHSSRNGRTLCLKLKKNVIKTRTKRINSEFSDVQQRFLLLTCIIVLVHNMELHTVYRIVVVQRKTKVLRRNTWHGPMEADDVAAGSMSYRQKKVSSSERPKPAPNYIQLTLVTQLAVLLHRWGRAGRFCLVPLSKVSTRSRSDSCQLAEQRLLAI